jgi:mycothiol synthase
MEISSVVDPTDDDLEAVAAIDNAHRQELSPGDPDVPVDSLRDLLRHPSPVSTSHLLVARGDGEVIGVGRLSLPREEGRLAMGFASLVVRADQRRQGVGQSLLGALVDIARDDNRKVLLGHASTSHVAGPAFAQAVGAAPGQLDRENRLRVADIDRGMLEAWVARASERAGGYSLVGWDGPCPEEWLERFTRLLPVMNDAPHSEANGTFAPSVEQVRAATSHFARIGRIGWTLCVAHHETDELVGLTELGFDRHLPTIAGQGDTGVVRAHRDKGLGRWLKAVNALRLLDERPEVVEIRTGNAVSNASMLSINHQMGFRPALEFREWDLVI